MTKCNKEQESFYPLFKRAEDGFDQNVDLLSDVITTRGSIGADPNDDSIYICNIKMEGLSLSSNRSPLKVVENESCT